MTLEDTIQKIKSAKYSSSSVGYHFLQPDIIRQELTDGSVVARTNNSLIGDPITPKGDLTQMAKTLSWEHPNLSLFHIEKHTAKALRERGYFTDTLGVESRVSLPFSMKGKDKSDLRRAMNRSKKAGVVVRELCDIEFSVYADEIASLNQQWLKKRKYFQREFRFLARPFVIGYQSGERRFVAFIGNRPVGMAIYDPVYRDGMTIGYFEAIVRNFEPQITGARDHLTITALLSLANASNILQWVSLGLCPFASSNSELKDKLIPSLTGFALKSFYDFGGGIFNCRGLAFHKNRYRGESIPIYFATKSRFPLLSLYRACRLSNIDPLEVVFSSFITPLIKLRDFCSSLLFSKRIPMHPPSTPLSTTNK